MASLDTLQSRALAKKGIVRQVGSDEPIAFKLRYKGTGTVTSVTVDNTAEEIVTITSDGGTDTFTVAANATIGAMVDAINAAGIFEAKIMDSLRATSSDDTLVNGAVSASVDEDGTTVWNIKFDTSASLELGVTLSPAFLFGAPKGRRIHLQQIVYSVNMGTAAADSVQVYKRKATLGGGTETKLLGFLSVDTTETTITFASGQGKITLNEDEEIFTRVKDAATLADAAGNFVRVVGEIE